MIDQHLPYGLGIQRQQLLYRLPVAAPACRVLAIATDGGDSFDWPGATSLDRVIWGSDVPGRDYDVVALPGTLTPLRSSGVDSSHRGHTRSVLNTVLCSLRPGGLVVGHLCNVLALPTLRGVIRGHVSPMALLRCHGVAGVRQLSRTLATAGFVDVECYVVEPTIEAPKALIPDNRPVQRRHFESAVRRTRQEYSELGYFLRLMIVRCGAGSMLQPDLFFWARRP